MSLNIYIPEGAASTVFRVRCFYNPVADHGLEGYNLGDEYQAEIDRKGRVKLYRKDLAGEWQVENVTTKGVAARYFETVHYPVERA